MHFSYHEIEMNVFVAHLLPLNYSSSIFGCLFSLIGLRRVKGTAVDLIYFAACLAGQIVVNKNYFNHVLSQGVQHREY